MVDTNNQFDAVVAQCRTLFSRKLHDYGTAWRLLRPETVTDQILIKANRIRTLELKGTSKVPDDIHSELQGIVNYGAIALIQLELGFVEQIDMSPEVALEWYDKRIAQAKALMLNKNDDYDEVWRLMRIQSYTDLILVKLHRTKQIENNAGKTLVSEGIDANYLDMINYAIFGLIRLEFTKDA
jgi:hypothetical protein